MKDEKLEAKEQLNLITVLAEDARGNLNSMVLPFFVFGSAVVLCTVLSYVLGALGYEKFIFVLWVGGMALVTLLFSILQKKKQKHSAYTDSLFSALWGSIGFSTLVVMIFLNTVLVSEKSFQTMFLFIGAVLSIGYIVSSVIIRTKIMFAFGLCWIVAGGASVFVPPLVAPLVICGATVLLEIIPAFVILLKQKKN